MAADIKLIGMLVLAIAAIPFVSKAETEGEAIYFRVCATCHGEDGEGAMPGIKNLTGKDGVFSKPDAELLKSVITGVDRPGMETPMPPMGGDDELTEADLKKVLSFMRGEFGK